MFRRTRLTSLCHADCYRGIGWAVMNSFTGMRTLLLASTFIFFSSLATSEPSAVAPVNGCAFQLAPLVNIEPDSTVSGPVIDYFRQHVEPLLGRPIVWQGLNVARLLSHLESGECELTPLLSYTPARAKIFHYVEPHLLLLRPVLVVLASSRLRSVDHQEDLYGMTIGWSSQALVPPLLQHPQVRVDALTQRNWEHGNMQKLLRGRIDAALFSNDISANHFRARLPVTTRLIYLPVPPLEVHMVLSQALATRQPALKQMLRRVFEQYPLTSLMESPAHQGGG